MAERARAVYLIGETGPEIAAALEAAGVPLHQCGDLERAVAAVHAAARPGEVVLLSPACASFDQYADYEARGAHFRALDAMRRWFVAPWTRRALQAATGTALVALAIRVIV